MTELLYLPDADDVTDFEATVVDVRKDHGEIHHEIDDIEGELPGEGDTVTGHVDEAHRRMHTAQHVLSQVVLEEDGASTAGNRIHAEFSWIDFEPADFDDEDLEMIEERTDEIIERDLPVTKDKRPRETVEDNVTEGRSNLDLLPDHVEELRVVEIGDFDMCPCGGTHVDRTGEIGGIEITNRLSKGADVERIEFELREN